MEQSRILPDQRTEYKWDLSEGETLYSGTSATGTQETALADTCSQGVQFDKHMEDDQVAQFPSWPPNGHYKSLKSQEAAGYTAPERHEARTDARPSLGVYMQSHHAGSFSPRDCTLKMLCTDESHSSQHKFDRNQYV